jgi:hypothetical protein
MYNNSRLIEWCLYLIALCSAIIWCVVVRVCMQLMNFGTLICLPLVVYIWIVSADSLSASPSWYETPTWDSATTFYPFSIFWQFRVWWCGAPSLTRSRVCTFQFLPVIASAAFLRSESHGTLERSLLSLFFRLPQPGGPGSCIYFPQEQSSPIIP